jgi:hypothetical protein
MRTYVEEEDSVRQGNCIASTGKYVESELDVHLLQDLIESCSRWSLWYRTTLSVSCIRDLGWVLEIGEGAAGVGCFAETYLNDRM